jgi:uncharacterized protein YjbI with pentapeptide repeats
MFNLDFILKSVAKKNLDPQKAKQMIEEHYVLKKQDKKSSDHAQSAKEDSRENLKNAFEKLKKTLHLEELLKISNYFIQHISESMPHIEKFQENIQSVGFSSHILGLNAKFSVFRAIHVSENTVVQDNLVLGSQWFGIHLSENSEIKSNKFKAVQFTELTVLRSDFCKSSFSLVRLGNVSLQEACFLSNKFVRSTFSDISLKESDFSENDIFKSDFSVVSIFASRLSQMSFHGTDFQECEFDSCEIQGVEFENCKFKECVFCDFHLVSKKPLKISNCRVVGKNFSGSYHENPQEFLNMLNLSNENISS